jgi:dTDP-4-dehydrorhamnose reductase
MKPKILLTGKNGQVGGDLMQLLPRVGEVVALDRRDLDLAKPEEIRRAIRDLRPQIIVNAAAYTAVDLAEKEEALARTINADAPGVMADEARKVGAILVHYSTDYVFDGSKASPYDEKDPPNPLNIYGKTKLAGEQAIESTGVPHLIFRTEWVYATRGRNFLLTILRLATQREELRIVRDQIGSPTWSRAIAEATTKVLTQLLEKGARDPASAVSSVSGTYHMTAAGETSWHEFANAILEEAARVPSATPWFEAATSGKPLIARRVIPITTSEYATPARRPAYSVLSNARIMQALGVQLADWRTSLRSAFAANGSENVIAD